MSTNLEETNGDLKFEKRLFKSLKMHGLLFPTSKAEIQKVADDSDQESIKLDLSKLTQNASSEFEFDYAIAAFSDGADLPPIEDNDEDSKKDNKTD